MKHNSITQDFTNNTISLLHNRKIVPAMMMEATFPVTNPHNTTKTDRYNLMSVKTNKIILPGESIDLDTTMPDQTALVEGWNSNHWPEPQIVKITQGKLPIRNNTSSPVILTHNKVNSIKVTSTEIVDWTVPSLSTITTTTKSTASMPDSETIDTI